MNARAGEILAACGRSPSRPPTGAIFSSLAKITSSPGDYGGADVNVVTGGEGASPHVTQSEVQVWAQGNTVVAAYNDSRTAPSCYSGGSYSTNGGATWTNLNARPFCTGHGTGYGDPVVYYDIEHSKWVATFLASGCGGQGIGVWFSTDGITWTVGPCAHSGGSDDRQSGWVDNNPASPFYGDQYVSWNNFAVGGGALYVAKSTDGGLTWGAPVQLNAAFIRNVQITTGPNGYVYLATMDEGGGGLGSRTNRIYRSIDGGATWTSATTGPAFPGPGLSTCGYFAAMYPSYWRHMGWGDIQSGPANSVHYVYAAHGAGADKGDIYYVRSTDNGLTWSAPLRLDQDGGTRGQWQPSLGVTPQAHVFASWYDQRNTANDDLQRFGRLSTDNGVTWQGASAVSGRHLPEAAAARPERPALLHGRLRPLARAGQRLRAHGVDGRPRPDQRLQPAGRLLRQDHDDGATATSAATSATATTTSATATAPGSLQRWGDHDPRLGDRESLSVQLRRLRN